MDAMQGSMYVMKVGDEGGCYLGSLQPHFYCMFAFMELSHLPIELLTALLLALLDDLAALLLLLLLLLERAEWLEVG